MSRDRHVWLIALVVALLSWPCAAAHASKRRVSKIERQHNQALRKIERAWLRHHNVLPLAKPTVVLEHRDGAKLVFKSRGSIYAPAVEAFVLDQGKETQLQFIGGKLTEASRATLSQVFGPALKRRAVKLRNGREKKQLKRARDWGKGGGSLLSQPGPEILVSAGDTSFVIGMGGQRDGADLHMLKPSANLKISVNPEPEGRSGLDFLKGPSVVKHKKDGPRSIEEAIPILFPELTHPLRRTVNRQTGPDAVKKWKEEITSGGEQVDLRQLARDGTSEK